MSGFIKDRGVPLGRIPIIGASKAPPGAPMLAPPPPPAKPVDMDTLVRALRLAPRPIRDLIRRGMNAASDDLAKRLADVVTTLAVGGMPLREPPEQVLNANLNAAAERYYAMAAVLQALGTAESGE